MSEQEKATPATPEKMTKIQKKSYLMEERDRRFYHRAKAFVGAIFRLFLRFRPIGLENLPAEGGCLICPNHVAAWDVFSVGLTSTRRIRFLGKAELFAIPLLGPLMRRLGAYQVNRGGSDVAAIKKSIALAAEGEAVCIFPQGHRFKGKNPADTPVKDGAGMIALRADCPVVPVCLKMKRQRYALWRRVDVIFGKPIPAAELSSPELSGKEAYRAASEKIFAEICDLGGFVAGAPLTEPKKKEKQK